MDEERLISIDNKLSSILKILAIQFVKDSPKEEQANILTNIGMNSTEIAKILGKSPSTIRSQRHQIRKKIVKKTKHKK